MDNGAKLCTGAYAGQESKHLHGTLMPGNYGYVPARGTTLAVAHLTITTSRLRKLGKQYVIFLGDIMAAFPNTPHEGMLAAVRKYAREKGVTIGLTLRYQEVKYVIEMGGRKVVVRAHKGVVTGDSLGPLAFLLFYHAYLIHMTEQWDAEVGEESELHVPLQDLSWGEPILTHTERDLDLTHTIYADDHAAVLVFKQWKTVRDFLGVIHGMQQTYGLTGHLGKSFLLWHFQEKGADTEKNACDEAFGSHT